MFLMSHDFWNRQAVSCPATPLIAKKPKTLLPSQNPQEYVCIFVLQTEITFSLFLGNKAYVIIAIVFQATVTMNFWVHEQTSAQFASQSIFYTSKEFCTHESQDESQLTMPLACWRFPGRIISYISRDKPRAQHRCKLVGHLASLIL